jgi:hypothetical protein
MGTNGVNKQCFAELVDQRLAARLGPRTPVAPILFISN